jgi:plastocyanin
MKKQHFLFSVTLFFLIISPHIISQVVHEIEVVNYEFIPDSITVEVGDTVRWMSTNVANMEHNVVADDGSFTSGVPAFAPWIYDHVFTSAGNNPYYCEPHGGPGGSGMSGVVVVTDPVSVPEDEQVVNEFKLNQNYPNPFNPSTKLSFVIGQTSFVSLKVYDLLGNEIANLVNEEKPAGEYEVSFSAKALPSGIYYYKLETESYSEARKMVLMK